MSGPVERSNSAKFGVVIIGRNEGSRLVQCLTSLQGFSRRVYVDSGSTDGSVRRAIESGALAIELEIPPNFTAARARNAGIAKLLAAYPEIEFIQTVDGDCEIHPDWMDAGLATLTNDPCLAAAFGRLRERYPDRSIYNAICDDSWNAPIGEIPIVGGVAMFRTAALREANFYNADMIAGEEPDLAARMRKSGWHIRRIDAEMGLHDADIMRFGQWWTRTRRTGHAYGELAYRHPDARDPNWRRTVFSIVFWGALMPICLAAMLLLAVMISPYYWIGVAAGLLSWVLRIVQLSRRKRVGGLTRKVAIAFGVLVMIGKIPQFLGFCLYHRNRLAGNVSSIIEHKNPARR
jgi:glycosyltransferase involved in cell wall biosynthesis